MSDTVLHAINIKSVITYALFGIGLGSILTFVPASDLIGLIILIVGLTMILVNGYNLFIEFREKKETTNQTLFYVLGALFGFILIIFPHQVVTVIVALYLLAFPIMDIVKAKGDKNVVLEKLPKLVLGTILLFSGFILIGLIFKIVGIVLILGSLAYLGYNYYLYKKSGVKIIK